MVADTHGQTHMDLVRTCQWQSMFKGKTEDWQITLLLYKPRQNAHKVLLAKVKTSVTNVPDKGGISSCV